MNAPLIISADAGAGKSSLIASCVSAVRAELAKREGEITGGNDNAGDEAAPRTRLFYHFVGAAPGSTDVVRLLWRMWAELCPNIRDPPRTFGELAKKLPNMLKAAGQERKVILFIDALNQVCRPRKHVHSSKSLLH